MIKSGIYIVHLLNEVAMPVTRDRRYVDACATVNREDVKIGKAEDLEARKRNYFADFDERNVVFEELYRVRNTSTAETLIKRRLKSFRKLSPKGGRLEWLEGISAGEAKKLIAKVMQASGLDYEVCGNDA